MDQLADDIAISQGSLAGVLGAVGEELRDLGAALERLQAAFSPLLLQAAQDPAQHRNAQALDLLTQRLQALAGFIQSLEAQIPPAWRLDLDAPLGQITLSDLAARLTGQLPADPGEASGLFEMF
jgi:hypothetical protein